MVLILDKNKISTNHFIISDNCHDLANTKEANYNIAILKGTKYPNNSNNAIVHKSPDLIQGEKRLLLRLDSIREHI